MNRMPISRIPTCGHKAYVALGIIGLSIAATMDVIITKHPYASMVEKGFRRRCLVIAELDCGKRNSFVIEDPPLWTSNLLICVAWCLHKQQGERTARVISSAMASAAFM